HTCYVASTTLRGERRRQVRERQAAEMMALNETSGSCVAHITPLLDAAVNELADDDRKAILLRFYERWDLRSIGEALGTSENAAQKRVSRALDELHTILRRRGLTTTTSALAALLAGQAVTAPPSGLAASIVGGALAGAAAGTGVSVTLFKAAALTKLKVGLVAALATGGVAITLMREHKKNAALQAENEFLRQQTEQLAQAAAENERLANVLAAAARESPERTVPKAKPGRADSYATGNTPNPPAAVLIPALPSVQAPRQVVYGPAAAFTRFTTVGPAKVRIEGTSSIHDWQVEGKSVGGYLEVGPGFPVEPGQAATPGKVEAKGEAKIPVRSLFSIEEDGKKYSDRMDEVMYEHMRAKEYPWIVYKIEELTIKEPAKRKDAPYVFEAKGALGVAGITNTITMPVNVTPLSNGTIKITGTTDLKMTSFKVDPPNPLGLGIKTGDEVKLRFEWLVGKPTPVPGQARFDAHDSNVF
ncbi:MAG: sigma factor-like helix-turn-helix DNA-binding protein, partial [Bryobacteraceae bacterium]